MEGFMKIRNDHLRVKVSVENAQSYVSKLGLVNTVGGRSSKGWTSGICHGTSDGTFIAPSFIMYAVGDCGL